MTLFFTPHELTKIVLKSYTKYYCTICPRELNQKGFSFFPRKIPYQARPKGPLSIFLLFCDRMDVEKPQRVPLPLFRPCEAFRKVVFSPKGPPSTAIKMLTISEVSPPFSAPGASGPRRATRSNVFGFLICEYCKLTLGSPFAIFEPWIWRRLEPVPACSQYIPTNIF